MARTNIPRPEIVNERYVRFADHEVHLSFVNDSDAEQFEDWWAERGFTEFCEWARKQSR